MTVWQTTRFAIDLGRPRIMGIVNVTPDSFSDAGEHATVDAAKAHCDRLCADGAEILDIGGESTRPGAVPVSVEEQCARVLPVLRHALQLGVPVSIDTRHAAVMRAALDAGADIVNDVSALADAGAEQLLAAHRSAGVCLMHMRGEPSTMQQLASYGDVVAEVAEFLSARAARLLTLGVQRERIVLDPGIGFAKRHEHNLELHRRLDELARIGYPLLVGWSRKASLGTITGRPVQQRLAASVAAALAAAQRGAAVLRVHDVAATVDALKVWRTLQMPAERVSSPTT